MTSTPIAYLLITAVEGGSDYWAHFYSYRTRRADDHGEASVQVRTSDPDDLDLMLVRDKNNLALVNVDLIHQTLLRMTTGRMTGNDGKPVTVPPRWVALAAAFLADPEDTDYDAEFADVVLQYAVLGDIIYG